MDTLNIIWLVVAIAALVIAFISYFLLLGKRLRRYQGENDSIYRQELNSRLESLKTNIEIFDELCKTPIGINVEIEPENENSTITSWDLDDIDRTYESHF